MRKHKPKNYILNRDSNKCTFCGKPLKAGNVTLDHYYPKSKGGTYDVFNLVASCKQCNRLKGSRIPQDWESHLMSLFKKAIKDRKISITIPKLKISTIESLIDDIETIKIVEGEVWFKTKHNRWVIKQNKLVKFE